MASSSCARALLWGALLAGLAVLAPPVQAQTPSLLRLPGEAVSGPAVLSIDDAGRVAAAWWSLAADGPELLLALSPDFEPVVAAKLAPKALPTAIPLALGPHGELGWALPHERGATLYRRAPDGAEFEVELSLLPAALSFSASGQLYWAGYADAQALVGSFDQPTPQTIGALQQTSGLALCVVGTDRVQVAVFRTAREPGIYLYSDGDNAPLRIAQEGRDPLLGCGADGTVHLAWRQDEGLGYASSADWSRAGLIATPGLAAWDLAHDVAGHAYLIWAAPEGIWLASDVDWAPRRAFGVAGASLDGLSLSVSATGVPHLLWWAKGGDGVQFAAYANDNRAPAQLRVVTAGQQGVLTPDTRFVAASNLLPAEIASVDFYLVARSGLLEGAWRWFATDADGSDGFVARVPAALMRPGEEYAVVAKAQLADGRGLVAQGDWLRAESNWPAILAVPEAPVWRGLADVRLLPLQERGHDEIYELWLQPATGRLASGAPIYLGAQVLPASAPAQEWFAWPVDARLAPDGRYTLYATIATEEGSAHLVAAGEVLLDSTCPPQITNVTVELTGRARDRLRVQVHANDANGRVERVDMFLIPRFGLGAEEGALPVWLGSDGSATGGWGLEIELQPEWRGSEWAVRAVAYDNDDLPSAQAVSSFVHVPPQGLALRFVRPDAGRLVSGHQTIVLVMDEGAALVDQVTFYVEDLAGAARQLGIGRLNVRLATGEIDTRLLPDGRYRLLASVQAAGSQSVWPGPEIVVDNRRPWVELEGPQDEPLTGHVRHSVRIQRSPTPIVSAEFTLRDAQSAVAMLGVDEAPSDGLTIAWDARQFIDGDYVLGCTLTDSLGTQSLYEWPLTIGNRWAIEGPRLAERLQGVAQVSWDATGLPDEAVLHLDYSPDGGTHWLRVAELAAADGRADIDTAPLPDSGEARFRLMWMQGAAQAVGVSLPLTVGNHNAPPQLTVLTPQPGDRLPGQALVAWEAVDPNGDEVAIAIWARRDEGPWQPVADALANSGRYEWDTAAFQGDTGWELRVVARDSRGAVREAVVSGLGLTHNRPPTLRLVWPNAEAALPGETVVLWSAFDLDGDGLLIDLYYSDNAGQAWYTLAEGLPNTGYYSWETAFVPPGSSYRVRLVARDGQSLQRTQSSGLSAIGGNPPPDIRLTLPQQDATLRRVAAVCWRATNVSGRARSVSVEARETRTGAIEPIIAGAPLTGCTLWDTLYVPDGPYELVIVGHDAEGDVKAQSTLLTQVSNLRLNAPRAQWLTPLPDRWQAGPMALRWRVWDPDDDAIAATMQVSWDAGLTWEVVGHPSAALGSFVWERGPAARAGLVRLVLEDVRGSKATLAPLPINGAMADGVTEITLSLARTEQERVARWLAHDPGDRPLDVSLVRLYPDGEAELLVAKQAEVGELLLPPPEGYQAAVCALADNGVVKRLVCEQLGPPAVREVRPLQPAAGAVLGAAPVVRWDLTAAAGSPLSETQRLLWSRDGRQSWVLLDELAVDARRYAWDASGLAGGDYWLRLEVEGEGWSSAAEWGPFHTMDTARPLPGISLTGLYPDQPISGAWTLHWKSWGAPAEARVTLSYRTAPNAPWRVLSRGQPPSGRLVWDTTALANGSRIWLRAELELQGGTAYHAPALPFTVASGQLPSLLLVVDEPGAAPAAQQRACWQSRGVSVRAGVRLLFSPDGGANWTTLNDGLPPSGCQEIDAQTLLGAWPLLRAVVTDGGRQGLDTVVLLTRY
jgi:hypothetical protein